MLRRPISPWVPAIGAVLATLCLLGPWARSGSVDRSSIDLLATAGALDVLSTRDHLLAVGAWYVMVVLAAAAIVAAAWGQRLWVALLVLPVGPLMFVAWWVVARAPFVVRWGAPVGALVGLTATVSACLLLMGTESAGAEDCQ